MQSGLHLPKCAVSTKPCRPLNVKEAPNARGTTCTLEVPGSNPGSSVLHGAVAQWIERKSKNVSQLLVVASFLPLRVRSWVHESGESGTRSFYEDGGCGGPPGDLAFFDTDGECR